MQSIYTRYLGATDTRGARIKVFTSGKAPSLMLPYDHEADTDCNHMQAAMALATKLKWYGVWIEGSAPDGRGNVYVMETTASFRITPDEAV